MPGSLFWISSYGIGKQGNDGSKTWWWHWFTNDFSPSPLMFWRDQGKAFTQLRVSLATYKDLRVAGLMTIILSTTLRYVERLSTDEKYKNICHCLKRNFLFNWILYTLVQIFNFVESDIWSKCPQRASQRRKWAPDFKAAKSHLMLATNAMKIYAGYCSY